MSTYTFRCKNCDLKIVEANRRFGDNTPPEKCPKCDCREVKQIIDATEFQLKGEGWYKPSHYD